MNAKVWQSAGIDFSILVLAGFFSWPEYDDITVRSVVVLFSGAGLAVLKGLKTYHATHPCKIEVEVARQ